MPWAAEEVRVHLFFGLAVDRIALVLDVLLDPTRRSSRLCVGIFALVLTLAAASARPACAQDWDAILFIDPFPSPYLSDWQTNPTIVELTIVNRTS